jgi:hypothetical protein
MRLLFATGMLTTRCCTTWAFHTNSRAAAFLSRPIWQRHGQQQQQSPVFYPSTRVGLTTLSVHTIRGADMVEMMMGGERYENIPMPESMKSTTLFVGNLCEFVHDDDLSRLFQKVSKLKSVPACVARKPDTTSLQYGFVSFPTVEEKEVCRTLSCTILGLLGNFVHITHLFSLAFFSR